jgi:hypothetical protein
MMKDSLESELLKHDEPSAKLIFLYEVINHFKDQYQKHLLKCNHKDNPQECSENVNDSKCIYYVEQLIKQLNPAFDFTILRPQVNADLIHKNLIFLSDYPDCGKVYQSTLDKLNRGTMDRNLLDDLRLAYEILLKEILQNDKPLEKQLSDLGQYSKKHQISPECRKMFIALSDYFSLYQNTYVKHDDKVKEQEVDFIFNLTSSLMNFLINKTYH